MSRTLSLLLVVLVLAPAALGGVTAAAPTELGSNTPVTNINQTGVNQSEQETPNGSRDAPSSAERARVSPVQFSEEWLSTSVAEPDSAFNTSGPFAVFSITEPLEAVRISQSGAEAELLSGGNTVRVSYADDAAPDPEQSSLYTLELFYADGSTAEVTLYASGTDVSVEAATLEDYKGFLMDVRDDAADKGYEESPDGVESYYDDTVERADLLDSLFVEQAQQAAATVFAWLINPVGVGITLLLVAVGAYYRIQRRGYALDVIANDSGKAQRLRERLRLSYERNQQTADEERLQELPQVGSMSEIYWRDAQGVSTTYQLAELARSGAHTERDGQIVRLHAGVQDLNAASLEESWLESVAGSGRQRVASYDIALSHMKTALERMMSTHGMGHLYRDTYERVCELIDERQEVVREGAVGTGAGALGGSPAPGGD